MVAKTVRWKMERSPLIHLKITKNGTTKHIPPEVMQKKKYIVSPMQYSWGENF